MQISWIQRRVSAGPEVHRRLAYQGKMPSCKWSNWNGSMWLGQRPFPYSARARQKKQVRINWASEIKIKLFVAEKHFRFVCAAEQFIAPRIFLSFVRCIVSRFVDVSIAINLVRRPKRSRVITKRQYEHIGLLSRALWTPELRGANTSYCSKASSSRLEC